MVQFKIRAIHRLGRGGNQALTREDLAAADARRDQLAIDMDLRVADGQAAPVPITWDLLSYPMGTPHREAVHLRQVDPDNRPDDEEEVIPAARPTPDSDS